MQEQYEINKIYNDEFGRPSGIFIVDKPMGITSHDMVYKFRKKLNTSKVGHAGALDPFATGILIILVGKALKLSDTFLNSDKEYITEILFGIATDSGDPEGNIIQSADKIVLSDQSIDLVLNKFQPSYKQYVPVFSSVKINGQKLRQLARDFDSFNIYQEEDGDKYVEFLSKGISKKRLKLPFKTIYLNKLNVLGKRVLERSQLIKLFNEIRAISKKQFDKSNMLDFELASNNFKSSEYYILTVDVSCSKGTYIRQLAIDIGQGFIPIIPSVLISLRRTRIGDYKLDNVFNIDVFRLE